MKISVKMFAVARDLAGGQSVEIALPEDATVADLKSVLAADVPALAPLLAQMKIAVDTEFAEDDTPLTANSDLRFAGL